MTNNNTDTIAHERAATMRADGRRIGEVVDAMDGHWRARMREAAGLNRRWRRPGTGRHGVLRRLVLDGGEGGTGGVN